MLIHKGEFARKVHMAFPIVQGFCNLRADAFHRLQTRFRSLEHCRGGSQGLQ